jgi:hypothetical protein
MFGPCLLNVNSSFQGTARQANPFCEEYWPAISYALAVKEELALLGIFFEELRVVTQVRGLRVLHLAEDYGRYISRANTSSPRD